MGNKISSKLPKKGRGSKKLHESDDEGSIPETGSTNIQGNSQKTTSSLVAEGIEKFGTNQVKSEEKKGEKKTGKGRKKSKEEKNRQKAEKKEQKRQKKEENKKKKEQNKKKKEQNKKQKSKADKGASSEDLTGSEISRDDVDGDWLKNERTKEKEPKGKKEKKKKEPKGKEKKKEEGEKKKEEGEKKKEKGNKKGKGKKGKEEVISEAANQEPPSIQASSSLEGLVTVDNTDNMRGKENMRPTSPKGAAVMALVEKFGGGTPTSSGRPVSCYTPREVDIHEPSTRKTKAYSKLYETTPSGPNNTTQNVYANKTGGYQSTPSGPAATKTSPVRKPSRFEGTVNKWSPTRYSSLEDSDTKAESGVQHHHPTTTSTTSVMNTGKTTTTNISALRNKFTHNAQDKPSNQEKREKKWKVPETEKSNKDVVQKENEKNRSPRKFWSPKKQATPTSNPARELSPSHDPSSRKRKSTHQFPLFTTKGKVKAEANQESKSSGVALRSKNDKNSSTASDDDTEEKDWARRIIQNRTSALIGGVMSIPKTTLATATTPTTITASSTPVPTNNTTVAVKNTPSRVQFESSVPKRTKRDESPKMRPKTQYDMQRTPSPRPKSVADTRQMYQTTPASTPAGFSNPNSKKQQLQRWCQVNTQGYPGVNVTNFSSSWADGLAFCALVHKFHPSAFNFNSLSGSNRKYNFDLAFSSAEKYAKVTPLLETEDMILMGDKPDWKCVFTYITSLYRGLNRD